VSAVRYELGFYIPEDCTLHGHRHENLKSYNTQNIAICWHTMLPKTILVAISITGTYTPAPGFVLRSLTMVAPCGIVLVFAPWIVVNWPPGPAFPWIKLTFGT
jgi:hypothetical protein